MLGLAWVLVGFGLGVRSGGQPVFELRISSLEAVRIGSMYSKYCIMKTLLAVIRPSQNCQYCADLFERGV